MCRVVAAVVAAMLVAAVVTVAETVVAVSVMPACKGTRNLNKQHCEAEMRLSASQDTLITMTGAGNRRHWLHLLSASSRGASMAPTRLGVQRPPQLVHSKSMHMSMHHVDMDMSM